MSSNRRISRRAFVQTATVPIVAAAAGASPRKKRSSMHVVVVGAGAFGGWTALHLLRGGARVTLVDAWGAGNDRASSGGETRVIRGIYGGDPTYIEWVLRSFAKWRELGTDAHQQFYHRTGTLWMFPGDDRYATSSLPALRERGLRVDTLTPAAAHEAFPLVDFTGIKTVYLEHEAGYLLARRACEAVKERFVAEGGTFVIGQVPPQRLTAAPKALTLDNGTTLRADAFVFACGPWLGRVLPDVVDELVAPSKQEVFFFGTPAGDRGYRALPIWIDFGERIVYGIPSAESRGFKLADDTRGEPVDPTTLERVTSAGGLAHVREVLRRRFPGLANAPLVETRVCQYENSPDGHFLIDRHPHAPNVYLAGGGSGHGFKLSPILGEQVAANVLGTRALLERFRIGNRKVEKRTTQMEAQP
jgi:glycine/D-amino acid oxidase-like deaminating enzyme